MNIKESFLEQDDVKVRRLRRLNAGLSSKGLIGFVILSCSATDIDECKTKNPCSPSQECRNTEGSYECKSSDSGVSLGLKLGIGQCNYLITFVIASCSSLKY